MSELCHHDWVGDDECAYCRISDLEAARSRYQLRIVDLEHALESIGEYWNGDNNLNAMTNALDYILETVDVVLRKEIK